MITGIRQRPFATMLTAQLIAYWPVWCWYCRRLTDGSDEPWGIVALLTALGIAFTAPSPVNHIQRPPLWTPVLCLLGYVVVHTVVPPLVAATIAVTGIALTVCHYRFRNILHLGFLGLCGLSLPIIATLQFYLGYPLRLITSFAAAILLQCLNIPVVAEGTLLDWCGERVVVDAPCSGIRMAWTGLYLVFTLACIKRLRPRQTWLCYMAALPIIMFGNIIRATLLFFTEAKLIAVQSWCHSAIGIAVFIGVAAGLVLATSTIAHWSPAPPDRHSSPFTPTCIIRLFPAPRPHLVCLVAAATATTPLLRQTSNFPLQQRLTHDAKVEWPTHFDDRPLIPLALSEREQRFSRGFPGYIARFSDGEREIILRFITHPSRRVHPAAHCLRGSGFRVRSLPLRVSPNGNTWGTSLAERPGNRCRIYERLWDNTGTSWYDVSSWYWSAMLQHTTGPWWAATIIEPAPTG